MSSDLQRRLGIPDWPGWHLVERYLDEDDGVGSWLLHHGGEALLLEVPYGLTAADVRRARDELEVNVKYVTASHDHEDHLDVETWDAISRSFAAEMLHPGKQWGHKCLLLGGEPLWIVKAPKHSMSDCVVVFRGVAMTGDIEIGQVDSVNDEVPERMKLSSMRRLAEFQRRTGYAIHSIVSAHLNNVRQGVDWEALWATKEPQGAAK